MLRKLLSPEECAKCRICCGFTEEDKWEIPLFAGDGERNTAAAHSPVTEIPDTQSCVFKMDFHGNDLVMCPAAGENGCRLGAQRPFDCRIWPFRVMRFDGRNVITLSPVCPAVMSHPLSELMGFLSEDGFADKLFSHAERFPETVKPYEAGYPILAVQNL